MKFFRSLLLSLISVSLGLQSVALAGAHSAEFESQIYQETTLACQSPWDISEQWKAFIISAGEGFSLLKNSVVVNEEFNIQVQSLIANKGLSPFLADRLASNAFYSAVQACYPNSKFRQNLFAASLIASDSAGRLPVIALVWMAQQVSYSGLKALIRWSKPVGFSTLGFLALVHAYQVKHSIESYYTSMQADSEQQVASLEMVLKSTAAAQIEIADAVILDLINRLEQKRASEKDPSIAAQMKLDIEKLKTYLN